MNEKLLNIRNSTINNNNNNITKKQKRSSLIKMFVLVISLGNAISNSSGEPDKKLEQLKAKGYRYKGNITPISHCNPSTPIAPEAQKRLETFMPDLSLDGGLLYIKEFLAEGGLGKTYKGVVTDSNNEITKNVIIKTLKLKNVGRKKNVPTIKHLEREINASSQLIHTLKKYISTPEIDFAKFQGASGIVSIIGYRGCELIQPEIDGYDLSKIYEKGFESKLLPPYDAPFGYHQDTSEALRLSLGFISILMAIHNAGFIHNDIKLENIMLKKSEDGSYDPAIIDLGGLVAIGQRSIIKSSNGGPERINIESKQRLLSKLSNNLAIMEKKIETVEDHITNINNAIDNSMANGILGLNPYEFSNGTQADSLRESINALADQSNLPLLKAKSKNSKPLTEREKQILELLQQLEKKYYYLKEQEMFWENKQRFLKFQDNIQNQKASPSYDIYSAGNCLLSFWFGAPGTKLAYDLFEDSKSDEYLRELQAEIDKDSLAIDQENIDDDLHFDTRIKYFKEKLSILNNEMDEHTKKCYDAKTIDKMAPLLASMLAEEPWLRPTIESTFNAIYDMWINE